MNTQEKADDYNERAKKQIRTKAYQKGVETTEAAYKAEIKELKKENRALKKELAELKEKNKIK